MTAADAAAVLDVMVASFEDLARRRGETPDPAPPLSAAAPRMLHLLRTDPGGAWVAQDGGRPVGAALALVREGLWGLSLLVVRPEAQSAGVGRALLERTLEYGSGARGAVILSSDDSRALRAYARAGFDLHPAVHARGVPQGVDPPPAVRAGGPGDRPLTEEVDRAVRGAAHGADVDRLLEGGARLLVLDGRGYAVLREAEVVLLAARDEDAARALLRAALAAAPPDRSVRLNWLTAAQGWAVEVALEARLELRSGGGAVFRRGDVGPFRPYLPSGAYL
jgi:GNAT superfamily N-acetyltransferase